METKNVKTLLSRVGVIVKHQQEMSLAKGEHYNMFSVLKIETRENNTHSAFITDLLNPKGAHKMGDVFLKLFLHVVEPNIQPENEESFKAKFPIENFETTDAFVKAEHAIGEINLCEKEGEEGANASGGRIDIFLKDKYGTLICIENKIHAIDQNKQIQRYYNYETARNTVFYLTLNGEEPSNESTLKLVSGKNFFNISYEYHIIEWLELCLREVTNFTNLRETINQYILLIKKLTNQLTDSSMANEIQELIFKNYNTAKIIEHNIKNAEAAAVKLLVDSIAEQIAKSLPKDKWNVLVDENTSDKYSGLLVWNKAWHEDLKMKFQGESRIVNNSSLYGLIAHKLKFDRDKINKKLVDAKLLEENHGPSDAFPFYTWVLDLSSEREREAILFNELNRDIKAKQIAEKMVITALALEHVLIDVKPLND